MPGTGASVAWSACARGAAPGAPWQWPRQSRPHERADLAPGNPRAAARCCRLPPGRRSWQPSRSRGPRRGSGRNTWQGPGRRAGHRQGRDGPLPSPARTVPDRGARAPPGAPMSEAAPARARAGHSRRGWQVLGCSHGRPRAQPLRSPAGWPPPSFRSIHRDWPHRKQRPAPVATPALLLRSAVRSHYRSYPQLAGAHHGTRATVASGPPHGWCQHRRRRQGRPARRRVPG